jgi:hypothetical protein
MGFALIWHIWWMVAAGGGAFFAALTTLSEASAGHAFSQELAAGNDGSSLRIECGAAAFY